MNRDIINMWIFDDYKESWKVFYKNIYISWHVDLENPQRKYTVAIYRQHKNWYFYLKRIWRIVAVNQADWLFWEEILTVKLSNKIMTTKKKINIVIYPYRYRKVLYEKIPDTTNPYKISKWKNSKKKKFQEYITEKLF